MSLKRIIWHWTAGAHKANSTDRAAYHWLIEGDGNVVNGNLPPEANENTADGVYAAHVLNHNTGSIGISLCAMWDAQESPFDWGKAPITEAQVKALAELTADVARRYGISISKRTVLTHAEVQPTLGVRQRGKWDINVLPGMDKPGGPVEVGDRLRELTRQAMKSAPVEEVTPPPGWVLETIMRKETA